MAEAVLGVGVPVSILMMYALYSQNTRQTKKAVKRIESKHHSAPNIKSEQ